MSYDLHLHFDRNTEVRGFLQHFASRKYYTVGDGRIAYQNPDTGVGFFIDYKSSKSLFASTKLVSAHVEINYFRPSYFGIESEIELSALIGAFAPRIDDPQMNGVGEGPYTAEGFLRGWNFGNAFAVKSFVSRDLGKKIHTMPTDKLRAIWTWNYHRADKAASSQQFAPVIMLFDIRNTQSLITVWPVGMPILLPKVDYVMIGRDDAGKKSFGLAPWSEVLDVVQQAGIDASTDLVIISYAVTPDPIARWFAEITAIDVQTLPRLSFNDIIDAELFAAATAPPLAP